MAFPLEQIRSTLAPILGANVEGQEVEIEARFGTFRGTSFQSGVSLNTFYRLRSLGNESNMVYTHSRDEIFRQEDENIKERFTTYLDQDGLPTSTHRLIKSRVKYFDLPDLFVRIAVSTELQDNFPKPDILPLLTRNKKRWTITLLKGQFKLDLTEVTSIPRDNPRDAETIYEVELEIEPPKLNGLPAFQKTIEAILRTVLDTKILYTTRQRLELITQINIYLGSRINNPTRMDKKILNQARDLKAKDLVVGGIIPSNKHGVSYTASIKADGIRKLLVIDTTGIYLVMPPHDINKIFGPEVSQRLNTWIGTIIEGELIPKASLNENASEELRQLEIYFLMYDCLSIGGDPSVRQQPHSIRLQYIAPLAKVFEKVKGIRLEKKVFEPFQTVEEFYQAVNRTLDYPWPFNNDGLIFTPNNYQYDTELFKTPLDARGLKKYPDLLKWKPESLWSIDFQIVHVSSAEGNYVDLYVVGDNELVPFRGDDRNPFDPTINVKRSVKLDATPTDVIGEFKWLPPSPESDAPGQLDLIKLRNDKDTPNIEVVALDVWDDMHNPVDEQVLRGSKFGLMFRYHNRIKWDLFRQAGVGLPPVDGVGVISRVLLDIGSGWGQDVAKMKANGFTHVICVEPDQNNRIELQRRLAESGLAYLIVPRTGQDVEAIVQAVREFSPTQTVDTVSYMLSLSFFFRTPDATQSIYDLINATLNYGGYFIGLTIDGRYVIDFFNEPANATLDDQTYRSNFTMINFELRPPSNEFPNMYVHIDIPETIVRDQNEDLTNLPDLFALLTSKEGQEGDLRMDLISEQRANQEVFMTIEEQVFTQMYTSFVLKRGGPV